MAKVNFFFRDEDQLMKAKKWFGGDGGSDFIYDDTDWSECSLTFDEDNNPEGLAELICNELDEQGFTGYTWQVGKKFNLSITVHARMNDTGNEAAWCMWSKDFDKNIMQKDIHAGTDPVLDRLLTLMPCADWTIDDGNDERGTTYCQYAWYEDGDPNSGNYLLGVWTEIDEQTGCMK